MFCWPTAIGEPGALFRAMRVHLKRLILRWTRSSPRTQAMQMRSRWTFFGVNIGLTMPGRPPMGRPIPADHSRHSTAIGPQSGEHVLNSTSFFADAALSVPDLSETKRPVE